MDLMDDTHTGFPWVQKSPEFAVFNDQKPKSHEIVHRCWRSVEKFWIWL